MSKKIKGSRTRDPLAKVWDVELVNNLDAVHRTHIVLHPIGAFCICTPHAIDDELIFVLALSKIHAAGEFACTLLVFHLLCSRIPVVEATCKEHLAADFCANAESHAALLFSLFSFGGLSSALLCGLIFASAFKEICSFRDGRLSGLGHRSGLCRGGLLRGRSLRGGCLGGLLSSHFLLLKSVLLPIIERKRN